MGRQFRPMPASKTIVKASKCSADLSVKAEYLTTVPTSTLHLHKALTDPLVRDLDDVSRSYLAYCK